LSMTSERSYRSLFENIQREMSALAPAQNPQAEGMLDMGIFNGVRLRNTNHYSVIERISQQELTISFGKLLGSSIGSKVKFYPPDTRDTSKIRPTLIGTIVQSSELSSIVRLSGIATESAIKSSWIYPEQINYGEIRTRVNCSDLLKTKLAEILNGVELVDVDEDIRIVENRGEPKFSFINRCGEVFRQCEEEELKTSLPLIINDFGRANYLRTLNLNSDGLNIGMELIHLKSSYENSKKSVDDSSGFITLRENDTIRFRFSGKLLTKRAYFTIIDIQPDNQIRVVFPQDGQTPAEFFLEPGEVKEPGSSYIIGPPFGKEIFQVIASERPIDLRNYFDRTVSKNLLPTHPFEKLIQSASAIQYSKSKGIKLGAGAPGMVNISSMLVNIVPTNYNP
jgi:metacaspase-1